MNSERNLLQINSKKKIVKAIKNQWIPVSITLLALISGGLIFNQPNTSASKASTIPTYKLINPETILNNRNSTNETFPNNSYRHVKTNINRSNNNNLSNNIGHKNMQQTIHSKSQNIFNNENINKLKLYQTRQYGVRTFSRVDIPFNKIRINRPVPLYNSLIFNNYHKVSYVTHGAFHILKAFGQYDHQNASISYLINVYNHNYYITNNPDDISFVLPSTNYRYYQNRINNILATNPNNTQSNQINESLENLNAQHVTDYKTYMSLYLDVYNLQQAAHPIHISHPVDKQHITIEPANSAKSRNSNQYSLTTIILKKIHMIDINCQKAANYDNQSLQKINNIEIPANANYMKSIAINEISINNKFVEDLINDTNDALNYITNPTSLKFEMNNLNLQTKMANNINIDAEQILNNDIRNLGSVY